MIQKKQVARDAGVHVCLITAMLFAQLLLTEFIALMGLLFILGFIVTLFFNIRMLFLKALLIQFVFYTISFVYFSGSTAFLHTVSNALDVSVYAIAAIVILVNGLNGALAVLLGSTVASMATNTKIRRRTA